KCYERLAAVEAPVLEAEDERKQIEGKGEHPQEGHHRELLAELARDRQEHHRGNGGEAAPQEGEALRDDGLAFLRLVPGRIRPRPSKRDSTGSGDERKCEKADSPQTALDGNGQ